VGGLHAITPPAPRSAPVPYATLFRSLKPADLLLGPGVAERLTVRDIPAQEYDPRAFGLQPAYRLLTRHFQTLSLHSFGVEDKPRSEEHTSELQSREKRVCRLRLEKKK